MTYAKDPLNKVNVRLPRDLRGGEGDDIPRESQVAPREVFISKLCTSKNYARNKIKMICISISFPARAPESLQRRRNGP